jgi:dTDP-4-dehydrorhamnose reductase
MRLLVVGASGLVGGAVVRAARARGDEVVGVARAVSGDATFALDLCDGEAVARSFASLVPDVVVIASAWPYVDGCEADPVQSARENVDTVDHVVAAADPASRIVFFSTDHVFDGARPSYVESDVPHPLSVYARHKLEGEAKLVARGRSLVVRTAWVFGPESRRKNFVYQVARAAKAGETLRVPIRQAGCPTFSEWLADETLASLSEGVEGVLHLTGNLPFTKAEWAHAITESLGLPAIRVDEVSPAEAGQVAPRPERVVLASERRTLTPPDPREVLGEHRAEFL